MWTCSKCQEEHQEQFQGCWSCGTTRNGAEQIEFGKLHEQTEKSVSVTTEMGKRFVCQKCNHQGGKTNRIAVTGTGLSKWVDIQHNSLILVACQNCGYSEIYTQEILEGKKYLGRLFDIIFGR
jgi:uncharacterized protein